MAKTIRVIGCAGVTAMLILLLPLCLLRNDRPANTEGHNSNRSHEVVVSSSTPLSPPSTSLLGAPANDSWRQQMLRLHRQKRYLLFPEGSSFQLVFDIIIPIVGYTNYAILGITCAVAWELPSKAPSELIENVLTRINDGTIGTVRRNGSAPDPDPVPYPNRSPANWQPVHAPTAVPRPPDRPAYTANSHGSYYTNILRSGSTSAAAAAAAATSAYANANGNANANGQQATWPGPANWHARQSVQKWQQPRTGDGAADPTPPDNWWRRNKDRLQQNWREKQRMWTDQPKWDIDYSQPPRRLLKSPPQHHIYPVFGKRRRRRRRRGESESLELDPHFERLHLQQHLSSRQLLFGKIERIYRARQLNGTACVLRALCESAQRQQQSGGGNGRKAAQPQSFIMELLSAIFQLPASDDGQEVDSLALEHISPHYLEAHRQHGNCLEHYSDCQHAFWMA
ncbi:uncharacterized protein DMAD_08916 [Drosophila madeirensis]|uniref:Uncharacterized protein n=1 Tax=Drosophila madeirensis TaxID=30013 RepID=A0AAU9F4W9_DROMD